jgi:hypothetical protein
MVTFYAKTIDVFENQLGVFLSKKGKQTGEWSEFVVDEQVSEI